MGTIKGNETGLVLVVMPGFSPLLPAARAQTFVNCAFFGLLTPFLLVEILGGLPDTLSEALSGAAKGGLRVFPVSGSAGCLVQP